MAYVFYAIQTCWIYVNDCQVFWLIRVVKELRLLLVL